MPLNLTIFIEGEQISPDQIAIWEQKSLVKALRRLDQPVADAANFDADMLAGRLLARKQNLGHHGLRALLRRELALSDIIARIIARLSRGKRRYSVIEILSPTGRAEDFAQWFQDVARFNREDVMIAALPEHYLIATDALGRQEVIETNGGAPMVARFFVDYSDLSSLRSVPDPSYAVQVAGVARAPNGTAIGGVRHQFRNENGGFRAKLLVEFPMLITPSVISGHRWHLACEFSNWIRQFLMETAPCRDPLGDMDTPS